MMQQKKNLISIKIKKKLTKLNLLTNEEKKTLFIVGGTPNEAYSIL